MSEPANKYRKENYCLYCGYCLDAAMIPGDDTAVPTPNSLSVCIKCAKVSMFDDDMKLVPFDLNILHQEDHAHIIRMQYYVHGAQGHYSQKH